MECSTISKIMSVIFTLLGTLLFLVFGFLLNIFIFEIDFEYYFGLNIPTISQNSYFNLEMSELIFKFIGENKIKKIIIKSIFNCSILCLFWIQHIVMSNKNFKKFMEKYFYYHAFERGLFTLVSDILCLIIIFLWQPVNEIIVFDLSNHKLFKVTSLYLGLFSLILFSSTLPFMMIIDLLGLKRMINLFIKEDDEKLKLYNDKIFIDHIYRLCRHPMQAGFIGLFLFSSCKYSLGRILFVFIMIIGIVIGVHEEEKFLSEDVVYRKISKIVKNRFIPNFMNLFSPEFKEIEENPFKKE